MEVLGLLRCVFNFPVFVVKWGYDVAHEACAPCWYIMLDKIIVKGARTHNLKNITVEMPRNKMIVFTGLSGSGKSSLAFDTIFAEGQRRYVESLSAYARQFLQKFQKPDIDDILGLSPAISIDQKSGSRNPRSTVATITEIYDYMRVLYARVGVPHCLLCDKPIRRMTNDEIKEIVLQDIKKKSKTSDTTHIEVCAPLVRGRKGEYYQLLYDMLGKGYKDAWVDGHRHSLRERIVLEKHKNHTIAVVVDDLHMGAFGVKDGEERLTEAVERAVAESDGLVSVKYIDKKKKILSEELYSTVFACPDDGFSYPEVEPRLFSFNSPHGACPECNGLGTTHFMGEVNCDACKGYRLRPEALGVKINNKNIVETTELGTGDAHIFFSNLTLTEREAQIAEVVLNEIRARLAFLLNVGLNYLSLSRRANTLSGGESQRIRLASQLGSRLVGALYVLDEPTIGLHQRDNDLLIKTLLELRDLGNTIIIVEHDEDTIYSSDFLVDIGPGAGVHGGEVVVSGELSELLTAKTNPSKSVTLSYLRGDRVIELPEKRRDVDKGSLKIRGGHIWNIQNLDADLPLGKLVAITGVSGSGKSSFLYEIVDKNIAIRFDRKAKPSDVSNCKHFSGTEYISRAITIDQSPIGRTPRSNPATYTGAWTHVRDIFASTEEARFRGWKSGRFSFNVKGGRCEACQGNGEIAVEMHFLPTVYVPCDVCKGKRFEKETLSVKWKGKNIHDILCMTVEEAVLFFHDIPAISDRLLTMQETGLGYLELGQSATTLSGGEAQRIKISAELYRPMTRKTLYLLDEPTVGLHYEDVKKLLEILQTLVNKGNSVVVIEHNMDIIKSADYVLDFGPEGGEGGGRLVAKGTPEEIARNKNSHTGKYLRRVLVREKVKG